MIRPYACDGTFPNRPTTDARPDSIQGIPPEGIMRMGYRQRENTAGFQYAIDLTQAAAIVAEMFKHFGKQHFVKRLIRDRQVKNITGEESRGNAFTLRPVQTFHITIQTDKF